LLLSVIAVQAADTEPMRTHFKGTNSGIREESQLVITNQADWEALWKRHSANVIPQPPLPKVDFEKESVLVSTLGQRTTGGYSIEIVDVREVDKKAEVIVVNRRPPPGAITIQALTAPIHIVAVPRLTGKVEFKVE
jgi:hypothetical protein